MKNYEIKITFTKCDSWRRISLPYGSLFSQLQKTMQTAFGFDDAFAGDFSAGDTFIVASDSMDDLDLLHVKYYFDFEVRTDDIFKNESRLAYTYDLGETHEFDLVVEEYGSEGAEYPLMLDCGGAMLKQDDDGELVEDEGAAINPTEINAKLKAKF